MKILVTGGLGYIGSHTVVELNAAGFIPVIIDNLSNSSLKNLDGLIKITKENINFHKIDCTNFNDVSNIFSNYKLLNKIEYHEELENNPELWIPEELR